jgi:dienelactone hydrolase
MDRYRTLLFAVLAAGAAAPAATAAVCDPGILVAQREYLDVLVPAPDPRCGSPSVGPQCRVTLRGVVFRPKDERRHAAIVYNHGSGKDVPADSYCAMANYLVKKHDFVLFVAFRRGHETSTGRYFDDVVDACPAGVCVCETGFPCPVPQKKVELLQDQVQDVTAAYRWLEKQPYVAPGKMALMGSSYGGILTVFTNRRELGQKAAVAFSPGAQSWENELLQEALKDAVRHNESPLFFLQPQWDADTHPAPVLGYTLGNVAVSDPLPKNTRQFQSAIYPYQCLADDMVKPVQPPCPEQAHPRFAKFMMEGAWGWGDAVRDFLARYGVR